LIFTAVTLLFDWLAFTVKLVWRAAEPRKLIFNTLEIEFYHGNSLIWLVGIRGKTCLVGCRKLRTYL